MTANSPPNPKLPRLPFVLLGLMTLFSFGGPLLFGYVLGGGPSAKWPPDRTVEWAVLLVISAAVLILMMACLSLAWTIRRGTAQQEQASSPAGPKRLEP